MTAVLTALLWMVALAVALLASEMLVRTLSALGRDVGLRHGILGLLVALGADGPEITSAIVALARGNHDIGLGVVVGSNIYNLAGLLGLAAVLAGGVASDRFRLALDGSANVVLTLVLAAVLWLPAAHLLFGVTLLAVLGTYVGLLGVSRARLLTFLGRPATDTLSPQWDIVPTSGSVARNLLVAIVSVAAIVAGSYLLVTATIALSPALHVPAMVMGTFILPVATSLPNTWVAVSLARRGLAAAAISATFNSNSLNVALGVGLPSLLLPLRASAATRGLDAGWLLGMTAVALVLLATRRMVARWEGGILLALYAGFVVARLAVF